MNEDNTNIEMLLNISYCLKTFRLVLLILNISFFIGMFWLSLIDIIDSADLIHGDIINDCSKKQDHLESEHTPDFIVEYHLDSCYITDYEKALVVIYFTFTSLSTVGFGDFHPISTVERLVGALVLLFGVAIFSYIMGIFIAILNQY